MVKGVQQETAYSAVVVNDHNYVSPSLPISLTLGAHAQRGLQSSVCVCVCVSVTLNLTCRMFVRLTNDTTYLTGNEGQNFRTVFSENAPLQS